MSRPVCAPWEDGAVFAIRAGAVPKSKLVKTRCGRKIKLSDTSEIPTCHACRVHMERQRIGIMVLERYAADTLDHGPEEAWTRSQNAIKELGL